MKKVILFITCLAIAVCFFAGCNSSVKYPAGLDTHEHYGDGTFQIVGERSRSEYGLFFEGSGGPLIRLIDRVHADNGIVYLIGWHYIVCNGVEYPDVAMIYAVISEGENAIRISHIFDDISKDKDFLESSKITYLDSLEDFSEDERNTFDQMLQGKIGEKYEQKPLERGVRIYPFHLEDYADMVALYPSDKNVGDVQNGKVALDKAQAVWKEQFGLDYEFADLPYEVSYDVRNQCWYVTATVEDGSIVSSPSALIQTDGTVLALWT